MALGPVTTGSSHITVEVGVVEPTMVMGEEQGATGIQAVILVAMLPRIGGTSWCKVLTTSCCFFSLFVVTGIYRICFAFDEIS